jgi:hypothetical protein
VFTKPSRQFLQSMFMCSVLLGMMILISACSGVAGGNGQPTTGGTGGGNGSTPAATTAPTQVSATPTQAAAATPTTAPVAFKAGGISFIGPVKSVSGSSLVMTGPDGKAYTLAISAQTDRSGYGGNSPTVGASVNMDAIVNQDGSFTATILKPAVQGDPDLNVIAYTGVTTSAVGSDRILHFTVGTKSYTYTLPASANLSDFNGNAQGIANNLLIKVKVQMPANTVVSVGNASGSTNG